MKNRKRSIILIFLCLCFLFSGRALADTLKLKDGREVSGELKEIGTRGVVLGVNMGSAKGEIWFEESRIESINGLSIEEAKAKISTTEAFVLRDKDQALLSSAKEGLNFVTKTRKLEFKNVPEIKLVDKKQIKSHMKQQIDKYYSQDKLETRRKLLVKLGLIPKELDYIKETTDFMSEEIAGYYDSENKKIYISEAALGHIIPGLPSMTIMHEQVHALQDQYQDLKKLEDAMLLGNEDKALATQSVFEGEATVLMYDAYFRSWQGLGAPDPSKSGFDLRSFVIDSMLASSKRYKTEKGQPAVFMEDLLFPYVWGGTFIQHMVNTKGWEAIDGIYRDMPVSSEQIMHPEKYYIVRDNPKKIDFPDISAALGSSWKQLHKDAFGEFGFYIVGKTFLDELSCKLMSEGWGGDEFRLYEQSPSRQLLLISLSKWDTQQDADDFFSLYKATITKKYKQAALTKDGQDFAQWKTEDGDVYIAKSGDSVVIIDGAPSEVLLNLTQLFKTGNAAVKSQS